MTVVNFTIPDQLDMRIKVAIAAKGFPSKAELFRFAVMQYLDDEDIDLVDDETEYLCKELEKVLDEKVDFDNLPSAKEQLKRLNEL